MADTPVTGQAPIVPHPEPKGKNDSEVAVEDVMKQYEFTKLSNVEPGEKSFIWPEGMRPDLAHDHYDFELPMIDLSPVIKLQSLQREIQEMKAEANDRNALEAEIEACVTAKKDVEKAIRAACEEYGFFQIINSGFPTEVVENFRESCRQIFDRPLEEKLRITEIEIPGKPSVPGYTAMNLKSFVGQRSPSHTWCEGLEMEWPERLYPGRGEEIRNIMWPGELENSKQRENLRSRTEEYVKQSSRVIFLLLDLIVASLGIPRECLDSLVGDGQKMPMFTRVRANNYAICEHPELTWGLTAHTDPAVITLLHQDAIGGLQIRFKDGTWHGVQPKAGGFIVNCGDYLQAWTNGRFLSAEHRVVANEKSRRLSIAIFGVPIDRLYVLRPRPECVDAEHPLRYRPFTQAEYMKELLSFGLSKRGELLDTTFGIQS